MCHSPVTYRPQLVSSSVLGNILASNLSQHSVIYLRGIASHEIDSILQFVYLGEANVPAERLEEFLRVSADLSVIIIISPGV